MPARVWRSSGDCVLATIRGRLFVAQSSVYREPDGENAVRWTRQAVGALARGCGRESWTWRARYLIGGTRQRPGKPQEESTATDCE